MLSSACLNPAYKMIATCFVMERSISSLYIQHRPSPPLARKLREDRQISILSHNSSICWAMYIMHTAETASGNRSGLMCQ